MVIPTLGERIDLLRQTLQSIVDQGASTPDIIVVCPKKALEARALAAEFGADVADDPGGISAAVNVGFALAKQRHIYATWMGDDDLLRSNSLASTTAALDANPKAVVAFGFCDYIDDKNNILFTNRAGWYAPWLMTWGPDLVPLPGILFRLSAVQQAGGFDEALKYAMDLDVLLKLRKMGRFVNTKKTLAAFRWHPDSTTVANRTASLNEAEMVKRRRLSKPLQILAPLWEGPIRAATRMAARRVNALAHAKKSY